MDIFDKTFAIADILQILSVIVAFTGIVSALMSIMLEKETGILRAIVFHTHEIRRKVYIRHFSWDYYLLFWLSPLAIFFHGF